MFIIMDERDKKHFRQVIKDEHITSKNRFDPINMQLMQLAEYVIVLKDETYEVLKDRFTGELGEFPIEEIPNIIKDRLVHRLKIRDQIHTDE